MTDIHKNAGNAYSYQANDGDNLAEQVAQVVCILLPRGLLSAGFNDRGDLLTIQFGDYQAALPPWTLDFFEHRFGDDLLFRQPEKVIAFYVCSDKYLLVPEELYEEYAASRWLRQLFFIEANEIISGYPLQDDQARYLYAWPAAVRSLIGRYCPEAKLLPFPAYQFYRPYNKQFSLTLALTADHVFATLYKSRSLQWHQVFPFSNAEDIAYHVRLLAKQMKFNTDDVDFHYSVLHPGMNGLLNDVSQYFTNMSEVEVALSSGRPWAHTTPLLQQLYACAL